MRLKATKTSLYKLVSEYQPLPCMKKTEFCKVRGSRSYFLNWHNDVLGEDCYAHFSVYGGIPSLGLHIGVEWHVVDFTVQELRERGMIDDGKGGGEPCLNF